MNESQQERLVKAFEDIADAARRIARSQEGLEQSAKKAVENLWPEPKTPRQAVVTHVPTEEEKLRERQHGAEPAGSDWFTDLGIGEPFIGERERQWIKDHPPTESSESGGDSEPQAASAEAPQGEAGTA